MTVRDIINEIFDSDDMKTYLCEHTEALWEWEICHMITAAPTITLQRKLEIFNHLAKAETLDEKFSDVSNKEEYKTVSEDSYKGFAKTTHAALEALYDVESAAIFLLETLVWKDDRFVSYETIPFYSYKKAAAYIQNKYEDDVNENRLWHILTKWELDIDGNMHDTWSYYIVENQVRFFCNDHLALWKMGLPNRDLNLPVPFRAGDIIEVVDLPFTDKRHALILFIGDNCDCCCVQEVHMQNGVLRQRALKHGDIMDSEGAFTNSALYSAKRVTEALDLDKEENVLLLLQSYMKKYPDVSKDIRWICDMIEEKNIPCSDVTEELLDELWKKVR